MPSFISACAAAKMLEGVFRALSPWCEGALGALDFDAPSPPVPCYVLQNLAGAGGTFSDGI